MSIPARRTEQLAQLERVLAPECVIARAELGSKKRTLELASDTLAAHHDGIEGAALFEALLARERLGSTALGEGVALPHCRFPGCERPVGLLMTLAEGVDFQAGDDRPVDVVFTLVVPEEATDTHLDLLSMLAAAFNDPAYRERLRTAPDADALYAAALQLPEDV